MVIVFACLLAIRLGVRVLLWSPSRWWVVLRNRTWARTWILAFQIFWSRRFLVWTSEWMAMTHWNANRIFRPRSLTYFEENVWKTCTKVCSIDVKLLLSWEIYVMTPWTIYFDSRRGQFFRNSDWEDVLSLTKHSWAGTECSLHKLFSHLC